MLFQCPVTYCSVLFVWYNDDADYDSWIINYVLKGRRKISLQPQTSREACVAGFLQQGDYYH
jgi:hypothetical protein